MTRSTAILLLVILPLSSVAAVGGLWLQQRGRMAQLLAERASARAAQEKAWAESDTQRQVDARTDAAQSTERRQNELERKLGGAAAVAFKTPHPDLRQMLEAVAHAVAPTGTLVRVHVDRFTEFEVTFELAQDPTPEILRETARGLLTYGTPYVGRVRFSRERRTVSELDRRAIELIPDWSSASPAQIEPLLLTKAQPSAPPEEDEASRPESGAGAPTDDTSPLARAFRAYRDATTAQLQRLRNVMQLQENSMVVEDVKTIFDLQSRRERLRQAGTEIEALRSLYSNPAAEVRRLFATAEADPLALQIFERGISERSEAQRGARDHVFDALTARQTAALAFLAGMESSWGSWTPNKLTGRVDFETAAAGEAFTRASEKYHRCDETLQAAMKTWAQQDSVSQKPQR